MILSHRHRLIFIKTTKTAGTSIELALRPHCGPDDVITSLGPSHKGNPQNHLAPLTDYGLRDIALLLRRGIRKQRFWGHMSAADVKARVEPDVWDSYFKFCVVRNPWDRVISLFYHREHKRSDSAFDSFDHMLDSDGAKALVERSEGLYTISGEVVVDRIVRYENLASELREISERVGLPPLELPSANAASRKDRRHFREVLTPAQQERISAMFRSEIERMGYDRATL